MSAQSQATRAAFWNYANGHIALAFRNGSYGCPIRTIPQHAPRQILVSCFHGNHALLSSTLWTLYDRCSALQVVEAPD